MKREVVDTPECRPTPAYFAQAVKAGNMLFVSGQLSRDKNGDLVGKGDIVAQTHQVIANLRAILRAAGGDLRHIVKITAYMTDLSLAAEARAVREQYFSEFPPASTGFQVAALNHPDFLIEMEAIAVLDD